MQFKKEDGKWQATLPNGNVIYFENEAEKLGVEREYNEIQMLLGREVTSSTASGPLSPRWGKTKKVRIRIDPDVEYLGNKKALA